MWAEAVQATAPTAPAAWFAYLGGGAAHVVDEVVVELGRAFLDHPQHDLQLERMPLEHLMRARAVQCSAVQCSAVQCSAVQCSARRVRHSEPIQVEYLLDVALQQRIHRRLGDGARRMRARHVAEGADFADHFARLVQRKPPKRRVQHEAAFLQEPNAVRRIAHVEHRRRLVEVHQLCAQQHAALPYVWSE